MENTENEKLTKRVSRNLKNLFLDPNNFRFRDHPDYFPVSTDEVTNQNIQKRTENIIRGPNEAEIKDLISSFKANGFIDVDLIQAKEIGTNQFLVLEGNRRVAALKYLQHKFEQGVEIGNLDPSIFNKLRFEIYPNEEEEKHHIIMGLKHISGNKKWSTINQAALIYEMLKKYESLPSEKYNQKELEVCDALGITKHKLRAMHRVIHLIKEYKESDFGDQFYSGMFGIFEEIIKKPKIKSWLDWDDVEKNCKNHINKGRLFSWVSSSSDYDEEREEYIDFEPIINKSLEIRELAQFIDNEEALDVMERERSLSRGLLASGVIEQQEYQSALNSVEHSIDILNRYKDIIEYSDIDQLRKYTNILSSLIPSKFDINITTNSEISTLFDENVTKHFESLSIKCFKGIFEFDIDSLSKINIFVGKNNSGKTSLIEAIYLSSKGNDIGAFLKLIRNRNKLSSVTAKWLQFHFQDKVIINSIFENTAQKITFESYDDSDIDRAEDYICSYKLGCERRNHIKTPSLLDEHVTRIHTFEYEQIKRIGSKVNHLCNGSFISPFFFQHDEIFKAYRQAVEKKLSFSEGEAKSAISVILQFIKEYVDSSVIDIRLVEAGDTYRFYVDTNTDRPNMDISNYGEGLQRIFIIALAFVSSSNGVLCIDEFETGIHFSLLVDFSKFIQKLSELFNVQVFLTTHSKECVDAFVENDYKNEDITGFFVQKSQDRQITLKRISGNRLKTLVENIDLDIREG